jgi:hypothetical protein
MASTRVVLKAASVCLLALASVLASCSSDSNPAPGALPSGPSASGTLDPSFGVGGKVTPRTHTLGDMEVEPAGNVYVAGAIAGSGTIEKLLVDGTPDPAFGPGGLLARGALALARDAEGNLYAAGDDASVRVRLAKLDARGELVTSFGTAGEVVFGPLTDGLGQSVGDLLRDSSGNLYLAGGAFDRATGGILVLAKLDSRGAFVSAFGQAGVRLVQVIGGVVSRGEAALDSRGELVVALRAAGVPRIVVMKFDAAGNQRTGFGSGDRFETPCDFANSAGSTSGLDLTLDADDNAYVAAGCLDGAVMRARVYKLDRNGSLVASFGQAGVVADVFQAGSAPSDARAIAADASGNLYVGGRVVQGQNAGFQCSDAAVAKLDASGRPISAFGAGGRALFDLGPNGGLDAADYMALDAAGRIYVAASARNCIDLRPSITPFVLLRLLP